MAIKPKKVTEPVDVFNLEAFRATPELADLAAQPRPARSQPTARQPTERYVQITETGARGFEALGCPMALVWFEILYRVWKTKQTTIELPNKRLAEMGVSRWAKYRAVDRLERAGWIRVSRPIRKTPQVTVLKPGCVVFRGK
jgi:hypothetical protein